MSKSRDAFRTISEVAEWLGVQAHVLRFWESKFAQVKPVKRAGGRRYYRPADMLLLGGIKKMLHDDGLTIKGVQKILREQGVAHVQAASQSLEESAADPLVQTDTVVRFQAKPVADDMQIDMELATPRDPETSTELDEGAAPLAPNVVLSETEHAAQEPVETVAAKPRPLIVDLPDPPADDEIEFEAGVLVQLATTTAISDNRINDVAALAQELKSWLDRQNMRAAS